jgi:hypothetical protein
MRGSRWVVVAAAMAVVVLVSPAIGTGKDARPSFAWAQGGITIHSYAVPTVAAGSRTATNFRLTNVGRDASGKLAIHLTGSSAFSIASTGCAAKSLALQQWCRVTLVYAPSRARSRDHAVLTASRERGTPTRLKVSGCSASARVYWADWDGGTVNEGLPARAGCVPTVTTLASGQVVPASVATDGTHVYWVNDGDGAVRKVPIGGGAVTTLATGPQGPISVAVDGTNVYWVNWENGTVNEVPVGGGSVTTLATGQENPRSVAVDGANVYWVNYGTAWGSPDGTVNEVPVGGGSVTTLATGQDYPWSVAVDGTNVYWVNYRGGTVNDVPVGGGTVTTLAQDPHGPLFIAVDSTNVYWVDFGGGVNKVPIGGGSMTTLVGSQVGLSLAVDGTHVYWGNADGTVKEVPLGGGRATTLALGQGYPVAVAVR